MNLYSVLFGGPIWMISLLFFWNAVFTVEWTKNFRKRRERRKEGMEGWGRMGGEEYHVTQVWCGVLHKVTFTSNLLWLIRWDTPQETCWWQEVIPLVYLLAPSDGCESHYFHDAKRNSLINMGAFPLNAIRDLDSNHHSFSDAELPWTYYMRWTYASREQFTLRSDHQVHQN